jgi:molecular chaperone HscB
VQRAKYLLEMSGVDVGFETNTRMPSEFLLRQLELRESLAEATDPAALDRLREDVLGQTRALEGVLGELLDSRRDLPASAEAVRKLMFLNRLADEIDERYETLG